MKIHALIIDPQVDFCDPTNGTLFVPGADRDSVRLANLITRLKRKIDDIHVTLDSHHLLDVAHPLFWIDSNGNQPNPFTIISKDDVINGVWNTRNPGWRERAIEYVTALETNGRYPLCIWPVHCLISTPGSCVVPCVSNALLEWCGEFAKIDFVTKGSNIFTEHYSALKADVPDPSDPSTQINTELLNVLQEADTILISGQALSHCVANTVTDIANNFGEENIKKFVLLEDTCSNVPGFEGLGRDFVKDMKARGMRTTTSTDYLA